ncbi:hypothetical protein AVEN_134811-1 [Araneus ventricosus]|uniref:Uncharacterized protein n=1 Tax=Araneus ventricosus TaxID=182803 RepID=A0A4Y2G987_ARAVE|nr:hypothetical protein AVEN_134811-1 [Araneus ventricosus]
MKKILSPVQEIGVQISHDSSHGSSLLSTRLSCDEEIPSLSKKTTGSKNTSPGTPLLSRVKNSIFCECRFELYNPTDFILCPSARLRGQKSNNENYRNSKPPGCDSHVHYFKMQYTRQRKHSKQTET